MYSNNNHDYNFSKSNNNDNNHQHHHRQHNHPFSLSDNGLHYFFNGLKLLNQKCNSPPSPTKQHRSTPSSPPSLHHRRPQGTYATFQTAANAAADSAHYCSNFMQEQQNQYQHHSHQYRKQKQALYHNACPPELVHNNSNINRPLHYHHNNNNQSQEQHDGVQVLPAIPEKLPHLKAQSFDSPQKTTISATIKNTTTDNHYQHYYSYYYNRQPTGSATAKTTLFTERRIIRKLPMHRMSSKTNSNFEERGQHRGHDGNNTLAVPKYVVQANISALGDHRGKHVLREKMTNNNITAKTFNTNSNNKNDDDEWFQAEIADADIVGDFIDVKDCDNYDDKLIIPANFKPYEIHFPGTFDSKDQVRMLGGADDTDVIESRRQKLEVQYNSSIYNKKTNNVADNQTSNPKTVMEQAIKLPPSPYHIKGGENEKAIFLQKKLISPPAPRVLLYNNQSPRPSMRHLPRLSPGSRRIRDFRKLNAKSTNNLNEGPEVVILKPKSDHTNGLSEINKNSPVDCYAYKLGSPNLKFEKGVRSKAGGDNGSDNDFGDKDFDSADDFDDDLDNVSDFGESCASDTSSDSENGYRSHAYKLTHSLDKYNSSNMETSSLMLSESSSGGGLINPESLLVASLFPNVPPYLAFSSSTVKGPAVPAELYRVLKWRVTNVMPKVVRCVLAHSGVRLLKKTNDWMGIWGKHMKSPIFKTIRPYQKINHLPGSFKIGRKDACWKNLQRQMIRHGRRDFGFMPKTFIIPHDLNQLRKSWPKYAQRNVKWIIKPPASARGAGIRVVDRWAQIPKRKPLIVQKYIERPLLINGSKFDLRLYVLVTSINPLRVFLYHDGLARFASVKYSDKSDTLNDRCMHLTNYSINKFSSNYSKNEDVNACHGHKWTIKSLWSYLANRGIRTDLLWDALRNLVLRTILAGEHSINNMLKMNVESKYSCFELFGFDVLLDAELIPWLLEVNISPSLHSELPLDLHVKAPLVQSVLNTALYNVPPKLSLEKQREIALRMSLPVGPICFDKRIYINYLSRSEKIKHNTFTRKAMEDRDDYIHAILEHLTPDDVRCLIVAEDELARSTPLERIFPTNQTYKYLKYTDTPRYYNRLLDAWECRYGHNRSEGIAVLQNFCDLKYHLEVPPTPAKKYFEDDDTEYYMPPDREHKSSTAAPNIQASSVNVNSNINSGPDNSSEINKKKEPEASQQNALTSRSLQHQ